MQWLKLVPRWRNQQALRDASERLADQSRHIVWQRIGRQVGSMSVHELRGYIRARSLQIVQRQVDQLLLHDKSITESQRGQLVTLTCDALVNRIENQLRILRRKIETGKQTAA